MKNIYSYLVTSLFRFLGIVSRSISPAFRQRFGRTIGLFMLLLSKKRRTVTYQNIHSSFPEKSIEECYSIVRSSYENLGITLVELLAFPSFTRKLLQQQITVINSEYLLEQQRNGKSMILLSGHYGNWELLAFGVASIVDIPFSIVVKEQRNVSADTLLNSYRTLRNNSVIPMRSAARNIIKKIQQGEAIAMLTDQAADPNKDVFVEFFGRPAVTYEAPAYLSIKYQIPIVFGVARRTTDGKYEVELQRIFPKTTELTKESIHSLTQEHTLMLEQTIRKDPSQWSWQHKRWKYNPKDYIENPSLKK